MRVCSFHILWGWIGSGFQSYMLELAKQHLIHSNFDGSCFNVMSEILAPWENEEAWDVGSFTRILVRHCTGILICCEDELFYLLVLKVLHFSLLFSLLVEKMWKLVEADWPALSPSLLCLIIFSVFLCLLDHYCLTSVFWGSQSRRKYPRTQKTFLFFVFYFL